MFLTIPANGVNVWGEPSTFVSDTMGDHRYTVEFVPTGDTIVQFTNYGHSSSWTRPSDGLPAVMQGTEVFLDDVVLSPANDLDGNGIADGCDPQGTGTPGYWKTHPEAWPVDAIEIGGIIYTKDDAISIMLENKSKDVTYIMFRGLVSAKLNVLSANDSSCVDDTIVAADAWMATNGNVGSDIRPGGKNSPWREGEPLYVQLDDYNNGLLCAAHRD